MKDRLEHRPVNFVGVFPSGDLIYVGMEKRAEFDRIPAPLTDHGENENGHVLSKAVEADGVRVIFQYWQLSRTYEALSSDIAKQRELAR